MQYQDIPTCMLTASNYFEIMLSIFSSGLLGSHYIDAGGGNLIPFCFGGPLDAGEGNLIPFCFGGPLDAGGGNLIPFCFGGPLDPGGGNLIPFCFGGPLDAGGGNLIPFCFGGPLDAGGGNLIPFCFGGPVNKRNSWEIHVPSSNTMVVQVGRAWYSHVSSIKSRGRVVLRPHPTQLT